MKCKLLSISLAVVLAGPIVKAQQGEKPVPPEVVRVSVDTATGLAEIEWILSISPDVSKYSGYYDSSILGQPGWRPAPGFTDSTETRFTFNTLNPSGTSQTLTVIAIDTEGNPSNFPDGHSTIHLSIAYDSCQRTMTLNWTPYIGWDKNLVRYEVYFSVDQGAYDTLKKAGTQDTVQIQLDIVPNRLYSYFIKAYRNDGIFSYSNIVRRNVSHPIHPAWIDAESASVVGGNQVELRFSWDPAGEVRNFRLYKNSGPGKPFIPDMVFRDITDSLVHTDQVLSTRDRYQYVLRSLDVCDAPVTTSNLTGNLVLQATGKALEAGLTWHPYVKYQAGVGGYRISRSINRAAFEYLGTVYGDSAYVNDLSDQEPGSIEDEVCYYVEAEENPGWTHGRRGYSRSNIACITIVPEIIMANTIIPNSTSNYEIKPVLSFLPLRYVFAVYDRWGNRIFETQEHETAWDGRNRGGKYVPEGAYAYYIKLTTSNGIVVEDRGVITVIYK